MNPLLTALIVLLSAVTAGLGTVGAITLAGLDARRGWRYPQRRRGLHRKVRVPASR